MFVKILDCFLLEKGTTNFKKSLQIILPYLNKCKYIFNIHYIFLLFIHDNCFVNLYSKITIILVLQIKTLLKGYTFYSVCSKSFR